MLNYHYEKKSGTIVLTVDGDVISTTTENIRQGLDALMADSLVWGESWSILLLDMSATKMLDSLGLNLLVSLLKRVQARSASLHVKITSRMVHQTLLATRLDRQITIHSQHS